MDLILSLREQLLSDGSDWTNEVVINFAIALVSQLFVIVGHAVILSHYFLL